MYKISLIENNNDLGAVTDTVETDFEGLKEIITSRSWAGASFNADRRTKSEFRSIDLMVLDIDDGMSLDEARFAFMQYRHIIALSKSHQKEKDGKPAVDRFRVVLFLSQPITDNAVYEATWYWCKKQWPAIDDACKDSSRFWFASPEVVQADSDGEEVPVASKEDVEGLAQARSEHAVSQVTPEFFTDKGELARATLRLLHTGQVSGNRNNLLTKATFDAIEQGYSKEEWKEILATSIGTRDWATDDKSIRTIDNKYRTHVPKLEKRIYEEEPTPEDARQSIFSPCLDITIHGDECIDTLTDTEGLAGNPRGLERLDKYYGGGKRAGEVDVWLAQAKTGKNTLWHHIMAHEIRELKRPIGYASQEMKFGPGVLPLLFSNVLGMDLKKLARDGKMTEEIQDDVRQLVHESKGLIVPTHKTGMIELDVLKDWMKFCHEERGVEDFYIDHLHMVSGLEDAKDITRWINSVKDFVLANNFHLDLIVQPRKLAPDRNGNYEKLTRHALRGSISIEQAVDGIIVMRGVEGQRNVRELEIEVHRNTMVEPGSCFLQYHPSTMRFSDFDESLIPEPEPEVPRGFGSRTQGRVVNVVMPRVEERQ